MIIITPYGVYADNKASKKDIQQAKKIYKKIKNAPYNAFYLPGNTLIHTGGMPADVLYHELGHKMIHTSPIGKFIAALRWIGPDMAILPYASIPYILGTLFDESLANIYGIGKGMSLKSALTSQLSYLGHAGILYFLSDTLRKYFNLPAFRWQKAIEDYTPAIGAIGALALTTSRYLKSKTSSPTQKELEKIIRKIMGPSMRKVV